jgi:hydrogenase maturation protease
VREKRLVEQIADAVLYEGYILYPYRPSAVKNQQRWNFGALCPESFVVAQKGTESSTMQTQCLVQINKKTSLDLTIRFLHLSLREVAERVSSCELPSHDCGHFVDDKARHFKFVPALILKGTTWQTWQEAIEREVVIPKIDLIPRAPQAFGFSFPSNRTTELLVDEAAGEAVGLVVRTQFEITGTVEVSAFPIDADVTKLTVVIRNLSRLAAAAVGRDDALTCSFVSTHTILEVRDGVFLSQLDPPAAYREASRECVNRGTYPVLVGAAGERNCMLSSPIILYDYPEIAPQSAGSLFDGTEIDEILTLRIMTLTDAEKREARNADALARQLLERTESMSAEQLMKLHGVMRRG